MADLLDNSKRELAKSASLVNPDAIYDAKGYTREWKQNLMSDLPFRSIERDLHSGAGKELNGKLLAAHSSAALALNTFGTWRDDPAHLPLKPGSFSSMRFEAQCHSGLRGTPPHLDLLAIGANPIAVESKCTEWMSSKPAEFVGSYDELIWRWKTSPWTSIVELLRKEPRRYKHLDAAQLVKHAFGLMHTFPDQCWTLVYLYWEPLNSTDWTECARHRVEIEELQTRTCGAHVTLVAKTYNELWLSWSNVDVPQKLHRYLSSRYAILVPRNGSAFPIL